jgi:hypothetical protein
VQGLTDKYTSTDPAKRAELQKSLEQEALKYAQVQQQQAAAAAAASSSSGSSSSQLSCTCFQTPCLPPDLSGISCAKLLPEKR